MKQGGKMNDNMGMPAINSTMQLLLPHCCSDWRSGHRLLALIDSAVDAHVFRCKKKNGRLYRFHSSCSLSGLTFFHMPLNLICTTTKKTLRHHSFQPCIFKHCKRCAKSIFSAGLSFCHSLGFLFVVPYSWFF